MKARVTINKVTSSTEPYSFMKILIEDESSGVRVCEVHMTMIEFAQAITGLSCSKAFNMEIPDAERMAEVGKTRETKSVIIPGVRYYSSDKDSAKKIEDWFDLFENKDGWQLWDDGLRSQQNDKSGHKIILHRYV